MDCRLSQQSGSGGDGYDAVNVVPGGACQQSDAGFLQRYDEALRKLMRSDSVVMSPRWFIIERIARIRAGGGISAWFRGPR